MGITLSDWAEKSHQSAGCGAGTGKKQGAATRGVGTQMRAWLVDACGFVVSGLVGAGIYPLAIIWFGVASPASATDFVTILFALIVPLFSGFHCVAAVDPEGGGPLAGGGLRLGAVVAFVAFWANIFGTERAGMMDPSEDPRGLVIYRVGVRHLPVLQKGAVFFRWNWALR